MKSHSGNLSDNNPSKSICDRGVYPIDFQLQVFRLINDDLNIHIFFKSCKIKDVVIILNFNNFFLLEFQYFLSAHQQLMNKRNQIQNYKICQILITSCFIFYRHIHSLAILYQNSFHLTQIIKVVLIIEMGGVCNSKPQTNLGQLPIKNHEFETDHDYPQQQFATKVQNVPKLTPQVQKRLSQLGPFIYPENQRTSKGTLFGPYQLKNGSIYLGEWKNGKINGKGKYYLPDSSYFQGNSQANVIKGKGRLIHSNGDYYEGDLDKGMANGQGIYVQGDITYQGKFKDNLQQGEGTQSNQFYSFQGLFQNGEKHKGSLNLKRKQKFEYTGQFKNNRIHGKGTLMNQVGKYEGNFVDGVKQGTGTFYWIDGSYYSGQYVNDQKHGNGRLFDRNGKIIKEGRWQHNKFMG